MNENAIDARLRTILNNLDIKDTQINMEARMNHDIGMDSLDIAELILDVEREFKIVIEEQEWENVLTYGELLDLISKKLKVTRTSVL